MTVNVSLTFATIEEAVQFLAGKPANQTPAKVTVTAIAAPAPTPATTPALTAAPAPTPPTAAAPQADALDFKADVVEALRAYSKKDGDGFRLFMAGLKVSKVTDLEGKPELWASIVQHCNG